MRRPSLASALVLVLGLLAVACSSEPDPPPVPASGVVTIPSLLSRPDLVDVDIGTEGAADGYWQGELVVIGLDRPADQRFVVRAQPPAPIDLPVEDSANHHSLEVDGHPAVLEVYDVGPGCGRNVLTVAVATDARLVVAGVTPRSTADSSPSRVSSRSPTAGSPPTASTRPAGASGGSMPAGSSGAGAPA